MNNQSPLNDPLDCRAARRQRREARRVALGARTGSSTLILGLLLILIGGAFLLQNTGTFFIPLKNWDRWIEVTIIPRPCAAASWK